MYTLTPEIPKAKNIVVRSSYRVICNPTVAVFCLFNMRRNSGRWDFSPLLMLLKPQNRRLPGGWESLPQVWWMLVLTPQGLTSAGSSQSALA